MVSVVSDAPIAHVENCLSQILIFKWLIVPDLFSSSFVVLIIIIYLRYLFMVGAGRGLLRVVEGCVKFCHRILDWIL